MKKDDFFETEPVKGGAKAQKDKKKTEKTPQKARASVQNAINLYLAIGLIVAAFAVGFFVRGFVLPSTESSTQTEEIAPVEAPPLSEDQVQQGELPPGHPGVGESETTTPSETTPETTPTAPSGGP